MVARSIEPESEWTETAIKRRIDELGPWFHNLCLAGVMTAPDHFLGDYPNVKWRRFSSVVPSDLTGKTVLDIGCNAGFYAMEMKRRGAERVLAIDSDERYLEQARFATEVEGLEIEFRKLSVYDLGLIGERFDLVIFMGVLYHLRHPLLALDLIRDNVARDLLLFQTMQRGSDEIEPTASDYDFWATEQFDKPGFPKMHFIEDRYSHDMTNWWIPNQACSTAMLRSSGFEIIEHPESEVYLCRCIDLPEAPDGPRAVYPSKGEQA